MVEKNMFLQLGSEVSRGTPFFALSGITSPVAVLAVAPVAVTPAAAAKPALTTLTTLLSHQTAGGSMGSLLLDVRGRDDLGGEVKPFPKVVQTLRGKLY